MKDHVLVTGGTGKTGRKIVEKLNAQDIAVRVGSRKANPSFDWEMPDTWSAALEGINKIYISFQPDLAVPGALEAIRKFVDLAKSHQVQKVVLLSGKGENEAEKCEQVVIDSGLKYTIVRASWFNQNFSESFLLDPLIAGHVALPQSDVKVPFVDTDDIADVAVAALLNEEHDDTIYELTGPDKYSFREVVNLIAKATGRDIGYTALSLAEYEALLKEHQVPEDYICLINYLFTEVLGKEENHKMTDDIERVLGRKPKSVSAYIAETAKSGAWSGS